MLSSDDQEEMIEAANRNNEYLDGKRECTSVEHLARDGGLRFRLPQQQKKNAETLLQEMFENELEEDDMGPKEVDDLDDLDDQIDEYHARRKITFATVDAQ